MKMNQIRLVLLHVNEFDLREYQVKVKTEKEKIKRGYPRVQERVKNLRQKFSIYLRLSALDIISPLIELYYILKLCRIIL